MNTQDDPPPLHPKQCFHYAFLFRSRVELRLDCAVSRNDDMIMLKLVGICGSSVIIKCARKLQTSSATGPSVDEDTQRRNKSVNFFLPLRCQ